MNFTDRLGPETSKLSLEFFAIMLFRWMLHAPDVLPDKFGVVKIMVGLNIVK